MTEQRDTSYSDSTRPRTSLTADQKRILQRFEKHRALLPSADGKLYAKGEQVLEFLRDIGVGYEPTYEAGMQGYMAVNTNNFRAVAGDELVESLFPQRQRGG